MLGRVLDALARSDYADNTIIVLWSDNGFHLGEKMHWRKFALWDESARVPLIIVAPGITTPGSVCSSPVSLIDIYPTLLELSGLSSSDTQLDGTSLVPLLKDPATPRETAALSAYGKGNDLVAFKNWRYIRYTTGREELYNTDKDPYQWDNLAQNPDYAPVLLELKARLPVHSTAI
jgi:arylsulfatase A-like enzyme